MPNMTLGGIEYEDLGITVLGAPYGGPEWNGNKDLQDEAFIASTEYLDTLPIVFLTLNHGKELTSEDGSLSYVETDPIGVAERIEKNDKGVLYRLYAEIRKGYQEIIRELAQNDLLAFSNTPLQRAAFAGVNPDGTYKSYPNVEIALTPRPANPLALQIIEKGLLKMSKETKTDVVEKSEVVEATSEATPTVTDQVTQILEGTEEAPAGDSLASLIQQVLDRQIAIEKSLETAISSQNAAIATISGKVTDISLALPVIARSVEKNLRTVGLSPREAAAQSSAANQIEKSTPAKTPGTSPFAGTAKFAPIPKV